MFFEGFEEIIRKSMVIGTNATKQNLVGKVAVSLRFHVYDIFYKVDTFHNF